MSTVNARDRLIIALDLPGIDEARAMVEQLDGVADFFKIGLTLQLAPGVERLIQDVIASGKKVFLDYKYYDIAETIRKTVSMAAKLGVSFLTIHGPGTLVKAAVEGRGSSPLKLFTVTVLTNLDQSDMTEMGYSEHTVEQIVLHRAKKALEAGCDGVIASGREAEAIRQLSKRLLIVTPGIRPDGSPEDDQKRKVTPAQAIAAGADYLVIGRPITSPPSGTPKEAAVRILAEMQSAFDTRED